MAIAHDVDVVIFEHLDLGGKKRGSKKQRLHLWKAKAVQSMVELRVHRHGIRISRVNAWNTSRLAYDGTGSIKRQVTEFRLYGGKALRSLKGAAVVRPL